MAKKINPLVYVLQRKMTSGKPCKFHRIMLQPLKDAKPRHVANENGYERHPAG
jgi:hypothetical protein